MDCGSWAQWVCFFDVRSAFITVAGYPLSGLELLGTVVNLIAVFLMARQNFWTWPIGILGVFLFAILFYQIRLYGDFLEQIYYLGASIYGWLTWRRAKDAADGFKVGFSPPRALLFSLGLTVCGGMVLGRLLEQLPLVSSSLFPEPPVFPYIDAWTTTGSFVAMVLEAKRRTEAWIYWTVINGVGVWLYWVQKVPFVAGTYGLFFMLGVYGFWRWWGKGRSAL